MTVALLALNNFQTLESQIVNVIYCIKYEQTVSYN